MHGVRVFDRCDGIEQREIFLVVEFVLGATAWKMGVFINWFYAQWPPLPLLGHQSESSHPTGFDMSHPLCRQ